MRTAQCPAGLVEVIGGPGQVLLDRMVNAGVKKGERHGTGLARTGKAVPESQGLITTKARVSVLRQCGS